MAPKTTASALLPTVEAYDELQRAFDHFNRELFDGQLPPCLFTFRSEKRTYGYFSSERFVHRDGQAMTDEIAINPSYFAVVPIGEILQTVVHEMVHSWQFHFGKPSRRGYHNHEWAAKMEEVGLMPSSTGQPGGAKVGEKMADYPIPGGRFEQSAKRLLDTSFKVSWLDRFPPPPAASSPRNKSQSQAAGLPSQTIDMLEIQEAPVNKSNRVKQRCPSCGAQAWGKPGLLLLCGQMECEQTPFEVADEPA